MAVETLTQGGLPGKEWFTLQEVADRWSEKTGTKVSPEDVLRYEENMSLSVNTRMIT